MNPKREPSKCASCPILSPPLLDMYWEYITYKTAKIIPGTGIKYTPIVPQGLKKIVKNNKAETAPEAPTALYQWLSLFLKKLIVEENISEPR